MNGESLQRNKTASVSTRKRDFLPGQLSHLPGVQVKSLQSLAIFRVDKISLLGPVQACVISSTPLLQISNSINKSIKKKVQKSSKSFQLQIQVPAWKYINEYVEEHPIPKKSNTIYSKTKTNILGGSIYMLYT